MVSFTTIPYSIALERGKIQDVILEKIIDDSNNINNYNKEKAAKLITKHLTKINDA